MERSIAVKVPLLSLTDQFAAIRHEIIPAIEAVMESQIFNIGPAVEELEGLIAAYSGADAAVGVSSGTDALLCSLMALEVGPGDEVITTPFSFFSTAACIWRVGAKPVFVDIEATTFNIHPGRIEAAVTERTKAIIPVHLYGQMADMDPIMDVAQRHGLHVIEDAAQAIGATSAGERAGSIGAAGCFSFYPTKNLGGIGDGGMIVTRDATLARKLAVLRNHGQDRPYHHCRVGGNFRLDNIQAAALVVKMRHLDTWLARRRALAARYDELLGPVEAVTTPVIRQGAVSTYNVYVIRTPRRDELRLFLLTRKSPRRSTTRWVSTNRIVSRRSATGAAIFPKRSVRRKRCSPCRCTPS